MLDDMKDDNEWASDTTSIELNAAGIAGLAVPLLGNGFCTSATFDFIASSVDTSGSLQWIRWVPGDMTVKYLFRKYYETIGPSRIIFGSDSSWFPRGFAIRYLQDQLRDCLDLNFPDEHIQMIFAGNAARLLKIEL